ncbi:rod shape-determining protein [Actinocorallia populi]|uniref:rod shape-determining protein n=1 Tax=Actinocorallia populi TaxID=2079200 RepID=UPI000D092FA5|nr:rod shape-determining protein [Actinocorallia populi]
MRFGSVEDRGGARRGPRAAVDLGSSRIRVSVPAREVLIDRPSSLPAAPGAGDEAFGGVRPRRKRGADRDAWVEGAAPPGWVRPIRHGMVTDARDCARLTGGALREAAAPALKEILLALPSAATDRDRRRAVTAVRAAADCPVRTMEAPLAAVMGAGRAFGDTSPRLVLDIGAGLAEMAVIVEGEVGHARSVQYLLERPPGSASPRLPRHVHGRLADELQQMLDGLPARLRSRVLSRGLLLTGGGALLPSLPGGLASRLAVDVRIAPDPARATIRGLARVCLAPESVRAVVAVRED